MIIQEVSKKGQMSVIYIIPTHEDGEFQDSFHEGCKSLLKFSGKCILKFKTIAQHKTASWLDFFRNFASSQPQVQS